MSDIKINRITGTRLDKYIDFVPAEDVLKPEFERLQDGNSLYEADIVRFLYNPIFKKEYNGIDERIVSFAEMRTAERNGFFANNRERFPAGLTVEHLPGRWLPELSFACRDDGRFSGYLLSSELSNHCFTSHF